MFLKLPFLRIFTGRKGKNLRRDFEHAALKKFTELIQQSDIKPLEAARLLYAYTELRKQDDNSNRNELSRLDLERRIAKDDRLNQRSEDTHLNQSPEGATGQSPGCNPGYPTPSDQQALKGRQESPNPQSSTSPSRPFTLPQLAARYTSILRNRIPRLSPQSHSNRGYRYRPSFGRLSRARLLGINKNPKPPPPPKPPKPTGTIMGPKDPLENNESPRWTPVSGKWSDHVRGWPVVRYNPPTAKPGFPTQSLRTGTIQYPKPNIRNRSPPQKIIQIRMLKIVVVVVL